MNETENENVTEDVETSDESQRTEDDVSRETIEETSTNRAIQYKADGQIYEEEVPDPNSEEFEPWMRDKLSGWRGKRKEKGRDDPGLIEDAIERGVKAGLESGKPKEPSVDDDPFQLMSKAQRKRYEALVAEGSEDERFQFLVDMGLENRKAHYMVHERNQVLEGNFKKMQQLHGAAQEMRMIAKMDSNVPDPDTDPDGAWQALSKPDGYFDWLKETGIEGSTNRTYKLFLADTGKEAGSRIKKATEGAKKAPKKSSDKVMEKVAKTMGNVDGGGAAIGREADETEIKRFINSGNGGIRAAMEKFGKEAALKVFNKTRLPQ